MRATQLLHDFGQSLWLARAVLFFTINFWGFEAGVYCGRRARLSEIAPSCACA
jgi:hypothetical protein